MAAVTLHFLGKVVLPLSKAIISVEVLYYAVYHWNDYFTALMYTNNVAKIQHYRQFCVAFFF